MGILGKLAFWRKEEPALPEDFGKFDMSTPGMPEMPGEKDDLALPSAEGMPDLPPMPGEEPQSDVSGPEAFPRLQESRPRGPPAPPPGATLVQPPAAPAEEHAAASGKDLEIISLKLDSLKTTLEAINERLARLEKMAESDRESPRF